MELPEPILLDRYLKAGDHAAFTELVRRHLPLVHAASLRVTRNGAQAEEAAQLVFTKLAGLRSAPPVPLIVWLHRTTRSASLNLIRAESRRRKWESLAAASAMSPTSSPWERISPVLDEVIDELPRDDRHLVLARFIQGESHAALARALGLSEDAARMRVNRALEKLRGRLAKRGITTTATALGLALPAHAASSLAPALFLSVSQTALASAAAATTTLSVSTVTLILMTKKSALIAGAAALLLVGAGAVALQAPPATSASPLVRNPPPPPARPGTGNETDAGNPGSPSSTAGTISARKTSVRPETTELRTEGLSLDITAETLMAREKAFNEARMEQRLSSLTRALNLTPLQNQELRRILVQSSQDSGNPFAAAGTDSEALEQFSQQLTRGQQEALEQLRKREHEQTARLKAQSELLELQELLALEPSQEQQASQILATRYKPDLPQDDASLGALDQEKDAALGNLLTPEQMDVYQKNRERNNLPMRLSLGATSFQRISR